MSFALMLFIFMVLHVFFSFVPYLPSFSYVGLFHFIEPAVMSHCLMSDLSMTNDGTQLCSTESVRDMVTSAVNCSWIYFAMVIMRAPYPSLWMLVVGFITMFIPSCKPQLHPPSGSKNWGTQKSKSTDFPQIIDFSYLWGFRIVQQVPWPVVVSTSPLSFSF